MFARSGNSGLGTGVDEMWKWLLRIFQRKARHALPAMDLNPRLLSVYFGNVNRRE